MAAIKILLVEDEGIIRTLTAEGLEEEGFDVAEARDGDEAVRLLDSTEIFDLLLTDIQMPGLADGFDVAAHARRLHPRMPVVVVSGYAPYLMTRFSELNPRAIYVGKPYRLEHIVQAVRNLTMPR